MGNPKKKAYTEKDYYELPENVSAELIEGELVYNSALPSRLHQTLTGDIFFAIMMYTRLKGSGCKVYTAPFAVRLFKDDYTIVEPDICVICDSSRLTEKGCDGAPDWIIEITSPESMEKDCVRKLKLYMKAGVKEYWIVDPVNERIFVYLSKEVNIEPVCYKFNDKVKVNTFDDFYIDFEKLE